MLRCSGSSQNPGSSVLDELQLSNGILWKETITIIPNTLYRKTRISTLFTKYTLLPCCDVTNNQLLCVCGRAISVSDAKPIYFCKSILSHSSVQ